MQQRAMARDEVANLLRSERSERDSGAARDETFGSFEQRNEMQARMGLRSGVA